MTLQQQQQPGVVGWEGRGEGAAAQVNVWRSNGLQQAFAFSRKEAESSSYTITSCFLPCCTFNSYSSRSRPSWRVGSGGVAGPRESRGADTHLKLYHPRLKLLEVTFFSPPPSGTSAKAPQEAHPH